MNQQNKKINRMLMVGWTVIVAVLFVSYIGEYIKGARTIGYVAAFLTCTILPNLFCHYLYRKDPESGTFQYFVVPCFFIMYVFSLTTGSTNMVFSYILPLLSLLILYHKPRLILWTGVAALLFNLYAIIMQLINGKLTLENSKETEIQIALILLCFGGCYAASVLYDKIYKQNQEYLDELDEKNELNQQMTFQTIMTIVNTIDAKDEYTKGHSQRVSEYSAELAKELGLDPKKVEQVRYIALLHDIGKVGVPDAILNKAGKLSEQEFDLMKLHTLLGGDILKDISAIEDMEVGARYHHERYDGKGYPEGLQGEQIPYVARIICVADAYDAMTSNRVYRKRLSDEEVEQEIRRCSGMQFDPDMAETFANMLRDKKIQPISDDQYVSPTASKNMANQLLQKVLENTGTRSQMKNTVDTLTSVYNKAYGERLLDDYLKFGIGALLCVDVDALRNINGQYGYIHGDLYLNVVAKLLKGLSDNQILYRSDGDEFMCLLCGVTDPAVVQDKIKALNNALNEEKTADTLLKDLNISVGAVIAQKEGQLTHDVLTKVERALYFAKQRGEGNYCIYQDLQKELQQNLSKMDLDNLIRTIQSQGEYANAFQVNYPEFANMINYIKKVVTRNDQQMQVVMFTVMPADDEAATVEKRLEAMDLLKIAVVNSLRSVDVTMQFSSSQRVAILMNMEREDIQIVTQRIISAFYKGNSDRNFSIHYDVADLTL